MNIVHKAVATVGQLIGVVLGQDFQTPVSEAMEKYPDIRYGR